MFSSIKLGYSCWGFLGRGIINTPDGGRSHRSVLINELLKHDIKIIMLQRNRDWLEAGEDVARPGLTFDNGYPRLDALFLEYRWPIPGRNIDIAIDSDHFTPDFARQNALVRHYLETNTRLLIWDKDQKLSLTEQQRFTKDGVVVYEPALAPKDGRFSLLFPLDEQKTRAALDQLAHYQKTARTMPLIYIGNRYERDTSFQEFYEQPSQTLQPPAQVYGKWDSLGEQTGDRFPHVQFHGRVGYQEVQQLYLGALSTVLIAPERYYANGHYTQRVFEALWGHCLPLVPSRYAYAEQLFPQELVVRDANAVLAAIAWIIGSSNREVALALQAVGHNLRIFSARKQAETIINAIRC